MVARETGVWWFAWTDNSMEYYLFTFLIAAYSHRWSMMVYWMADISTRALQVWRKYVKGWHPSNALNALNLPRFTHTHFHFCRQTASLMCHVISERTSTKQRTASISTWLGQSTVTSLFEQIRMFEYRWIIKFYFHFRYLPKSAMVEWNDLCAIVNPACSVLISITRSTHHTLEWCTVILEAM